MRDDHCSYSYDGQLIGSKAFASLHGGKYINDEMVDLVGRMANNRNRDLIHSGDLEHKCCIVGSYFAKQLIGLRDPPQRSSGRTRLLGFQEHEIPFSKSLRDSRRDEDLMRYPRTWREQVLQKPVERSEFPSVFEAGWDKLLIRLNVTQHHWFFNEVDFREKNIIAHDSTPIVEQELKIDHGATRIVEMVEDATVRDIDTVTLWNACEKVGLPRGGNKKDLLYKLMRPMFLQETFFWLQEEGKRGDPQIEALESAWSHEDVVALETNGKCMMVHLAMAGDSAEDS